MHDGRAIALAGLMAGLVGLAPVVAVPGVVQVIAQTADQRKVEGDRLLKNSEIENSARQVLEPAEKVANAEQGKEEAERLETQVTEKLFKGELEAAYQSNQQALTIYRALKDRRGELSVLENFATMFFWIFDSSDRDRRTKVLQYYEQALVIARELQDREAEGRILKSIGLASEIH